MHVTHRVFLSIYTRSQIEEKKAIISALRYKNSSSWQRRTARDGEGQSSGAACRCCRARRIVLRDPLLHRPAAAGLPRRAAELSAILRGAALRGKLPPDQRVTWRGDSALADGSDQSKKHHYTSTYMHRDLHPASSRNTWMISNTG
jgi:hypothetical protein